MKLITFLIAFLVSLSTFADDAFLTGLPDVPLMDGLIPNPTANIDFDTPAGQITVVNATGNSLTGDEILSFYQKTLPALGWRTDGENRFVREKDSLTITITKETKPAIVQFETTMANGQE